MTGNEIINVNASANNGRPGAVAPTVRFGYSRKLGGLACLLAAAALFTCEPIPDHCGRLQRYDPKFQFCFNGKAYNQCGGGEYNPLTEGCDKNAVSTRCLDSTFVPLGTPCGGYALTTAAAPANGGAILRIPDEQRYPAGKQVALSAAAAEGYTFAGWAGAQASENATMTVTMDNNKPLIAIFTPNSAPGAAEHTLITTAFPANGGSITRTPDAASYDAGTEVTVTATPNPGYAFTGWSGAATSGSPETGITMDGGKTLVAMFTPVMHLFTARANPAAGGAVFVNGTALVGATPQNAGTEVQVWAQPEAGYVFTGWEGAATGTDNPRTITITSDNPTLTANFRQQSDGAGEAPPPLPTTYTLTVNQSPAVGGSVSRNPDAPSYVAGTSAAVTAAAAEGYRFAGWAGTALTDNPLTVTMDGSRTLTAIFEREDGDTTHIHIWGDWTTTTPATCDAPGMETRTCLIDAGHTQTQEIPQLSGAECDDDPDTCDVDPGSEECCAYDPGHPSCDDDPDPCDANPGSEECCAEQPAHSSCPVIPTYTLEINIDPTGSGTLVVRNPNRASYAHGTEVTVTVSANEGYEFVAWSGASYSTNATTKITMDDNLTLTAYFKSTTVTPTTYTLTVNRTPTAGGTVTGSGTFESGTNAPITATENPGYTFSGWTPTTGVADPNSASTTVLMSTNRTVTANFTQTVTPPTTYTLSVSASPTTGGTVTGSGTFVYGTYAPITATANSGYAFSGWTPTTGVVSASSANTTVSITENKTVTANFTQYFNPDINYGSFTDPRNSKSYRTIVIGGKTWMAENLNYTTGDSWCNDSYCEKYGRLYTWDAAMSACPAGWHLPSRGEWEELAATAGGSNIGGMKLKSGTGWDGTDEFGFSALPGGYFYTNVVYYVGSYGRWWSATEYGSGVAYNRNMNSGHKGVLEGYDAKSYGFSVRCIQGPPPTTYTLSVSASPTAGGTVTGSGTFESGTIAPITAATNQGYTFTGWTPTAGVANPSSANTTVSMTANRTVTANFAPITYTLTVNRNPTIGGTTTPAASQTGITAGMPVSITASANSGYTFVNWTAGSGAAITDANSAATTVTLSANATVTANFRLETVTPPSGTFNDPRDGKTYKYVTIGGKAWMAENLNYAGSGGSTGVCYSGFNWYTNEQETSGCAKYGRLYTWAEVMNGASSSSSSPSGVQGICPAGWHVPSDAEWTALTGAVGDWEIIAGTKLKSKSGWYTGSDYIQGTDDFGFSALPGGYGNDTGSDFGNAGHNGYWWSATGDAAGNPWIRYMNYGGEGVYRDFIGSVQFSLRCSQDYVR